MGLFRSACFTMAYTTVQELFGEYGADIVVMFTHAPYAFGVLIGAPISGIIIVMNNCWVISVTDIDPVDCDHCGTFVWLLKNSQSPKCSLA